MMNLFNKIISFGKSNKIFALSKLPKLIFLFSAVLLIISISNAYFIFQEGKEAQVNAQELLVKFEQKILISKEPTATIIPEVPKEDPISTITPEVPTIEPVATITPEVSSQESILNTTLDPIAKLSIEKIDLEISILPEWSYALLKLSVCKFAGPEPNEPGNFIIVGHNDLRGVHFGKLKLLSLGEIINITDLSGRTIDYEIYEILTVYPTEMNKLETNEHQTVTLVTCNSKGDMRLLIKAKAIL